MLYYIRDTKHRFWTGTRWGTKPYAKLYSEADKASAVIPRDGQFIPQHRVLVNRDKINRYKRKIIYFALYHESNNVAELYGVFSIKFRNELSDILNEIIEYYGFHTRRKEQFKLAETFVDMANHGAAGVVKEITRESEKIIFVGLSEVEFNNMVVKP